MHHTKDRHATSSIPMDHFDSQPCRYSNRKTLLVTRLFIQYAVNCYYVLNEETATCRVMILLLEASDICEWLNFKYMFNLERKYNSSLNVFDEDAEITGI